MIPTDIVQRVRSQRFYDDQVAHVEMLPERPARFAPLDPPLHPRVAGALAADGIHELFTHQAEAVTLLRHGADVVVVTGTASGKTLCYNLPVAETLACDPLATALYLFPTKALAQDQLRGVARFTNVGGDSSFVAGVYDGDTSQSLRRKLRDTASIILTNPDMLHQGILPGHSRWNRFFAHLRYVVIDEVHAYRGVFGSHLANLMRRLERICAHYGSRPQVVCCSATIGNPQEHAARITGRPVVAVTDDGSPRGPRQFVLWNPPRITVDGAETPAATLAGGDRRSPLHEAVWLLGLLVQNGTQTIAFVRTRLAAERILKETREDLRRVSRRLAEQVEAYRGGYLAEERREIERRLVTREVMGVASTNALELGIDIGSLEACLMVGYPGTVASLWQQAGRAGRGRGPSLVILIAQNSPIDQYLMAHSDYLFSRCPEEAVIDPDNPHIVIGHLRCAMHEMSMREDELSLFGVVGPVVAEVLAEDGEARRIGGRWYRSVTDHPASSVSLRNMSGVVYTIQDETNGSRVIGTMDEPSAYAQLHRNAVYLHAGETYLVRSLDLEQKIAHVERTSLEHYTQAVQVSQIRIDDTDTERVWRGATAGCGDVTVTTSIPMFRKNRFHARDSLGFETLDLPPQTLETVGVWLAPPDDLAAALRERQLIPLEALMGIANVLLAVAPMFVMCDESDIGVTVDPAPLGRDAVFLFDRYPGGMGFALRCLDRLEEMMQTVYEVVRDCSCEDGCPSCVGSAQPVYASTDLDSVVRGRILSRASARALLEGMLA